MKQSRQENLIYLAVWGLLFLAPLISLYVRMASGSGESFDWAEVFMVWRRFAVYLALFLAHNFLLAPLLVCRQRRVAYFSIVVVVIAAFAIYQCNSRPQEPRRHRPPMEQHQPPMDRRDHQPGRHDPPPFDEPPGGFEGKRPPSDRPRPEMRNRQTPPVIVGERDIMAVIVLMMMFAVNLGIKVYFRSRDDRRRLVELERENLEQQLEYLRYQINPHFFMNTLNNIHALVDIDPAKAQETIVELSKMMRFVLYEGNKQGVPLSRELDFIGHYVALMQLRYTENVRIEMELPSEVPERQIPPLLLITFIENAFKHGISYQQESFIEIKIAVEGDELHFACRNSKADTPNTPLNPPEGGKTGGVGLANVRKRLNLIYGSDYALKVKDAPDVYSVELMIPLKS